MAHRSAPIEDRLLVQIEALQTSADRALAPRAPQRPSAGAPWGRQESNLHRTDYESAALSG